MARSPLWLALSFLAAARLAVPAGAADVVAPAELAPAPVSGAGASLSGVGGGVSLVPSLTAGLNSPLAGPLVAAPSAFPAALAPSPLTAAPAAHAAQAVAPVPVEHAALPTLPAPFVSVAVPNWSAKSGAFNGANPYINPGADANLKIGNLDSPGRRRAGGNGQESTLTGALGDSKLKAMFDGSSAVGGTLETDPTVPVRVSQFEVASGKWDYFFGRVKPRFVEGMSKEEIKKQRHNADRSAQIARILAENGILDTASGRARVMELFHEAASATTIRAVATPRGIALIKPAELPTATLEVSFYYPQNADGKDNFDSPASVTSIIPKEH